MFCPRGNSQKSVEPTNPESTKLKMMTKRFEMVCAEGDSCVSWKVWKWTVPVLTESSKSGEVTERAHGGWKKDVY